MLKAHRVAWVVYYGKWPKGQIDHINGDRADNRIGNLRDVNSSKNSRNSKMKSNNTSGHNGIYWYERYGKWQVSGGADGRKKHIGYFEDLEDAIAARAEFNRQNGYSERHGSEAAA